MMTPPLTPREAYMLGPHVLSGAMYGARLGDGGKIERSFERARKL
jgi:hypothetical protein